MQRISQIWPGWQADALIGEGGFGKVYRASHTVGGHTSYAAIKVIQVPRDQSEVASLAAMGMDALSIRSYYEGVAQTLVSEIALMDTLKGAPNIVHIEDYQLLENADGVGWNLYIRMELLEPLSARLQTTGLPSVDETARMGVDLCIALGRCHQIGIIHRDVKPANVFCSPYGEYKLGDFGLARRIEEGSHSGMSHAGTNGYMAPEVQTGRYDHRVDIYSLGMMLYRYLNNGRPAFINPSSTPSRTDLDYALLMQRTGQRPPLPAGDGVPVALASIVHRACEPEPDDRWPNAAQFGAALQSWLDGSPVSVPNVEAKAEPAQEHPEPAAPQASSRQFLSDLKKVQVDAVGNNRRAPTESHTAKPPATPVIDDASLARITAILNRSAEAWQEYASVVDWRNGDATGWAMGSQEFQQARTIFNSLTMELMTVAAGASNSAVDKARKATRAFSAYCDVNNQQILAQTRIQHAREVSQVLGTQSIDSLMDKDTQAQAAPAPANSPAQRSAASTTPAAPASQKAGVGDKAFRAILWLIAVAIGIVLTQVIVPALGAYALPVLGVACVLIFLFTRNSS